MATKFRRGGQQLTTNEGRQHAVYELE